MAKTPVILLVEDEAAMREGLVHNIEFEGYEVRAAADGPSGYEAAQSADIDLAILDVMMPGMDGFELARRLRQDGFDGPVLFLTARGTEEDKLEGFRAGADDYVTKPFSVLELLARVKALLRRSVADGAGRLDSFAFRDIDIDFVAMEVKKAGKVIDFSLKELEMLRLLIERSGEAVSRSDLLKFVWGYEEESMPTTRTIDTHVARLRSKLGGPDGCDFIKTVHKVGYKFQD
jgi:two-component system, OmpR family, alkaline phosphatase synthesis response regulator PhoP